MTTFRKTDRNFAEDLFRNAEQQEINGNGSLGNEIERQFLLDNKTGEIIPIKIKHTALTIDNNGMPVVQVNIGDALLDCGHRPCSLEQVLRIINYKSLYSVFNKLGSSVICCSYYRNP